MNLQHLKAFWWLRWRIRINQIRKGGIANQVLLILAGLSIVGSGLSLFAMFLFLGSLLLPEASPAILMYVVDGLLIAFLMSWCVGLLTDLQRSEVLSLDKFLHLPVSIGGAFFINYLSSMLSITLVMFLPAMLGLSVALVLAKGPELLLAVPLLAAFLFMVTALTYQFQGWLASLMSNPRRRRTVVVMVTIGFILLCQAPNLISMMRPWEQAIVVPPPSVAPVEMQELGRLKAEGKISDEEFARRNAEQNQRYHQAAKQAKAALEQANQQRREEIESTIEIMNWCVPPGWVAYGVKAVAEGNPWPGLAGFLALGLIGAVSLRRAYKTTLRIYTGDFSKGSAATTTKTRAEAPPLGAVSAGMVERVLPWVSEHASAIAMATLRSLLRAPEAKMLLLTPIIMVVVFGSMAVVNNVQPPWWSRPLIALGIVVLMLMTLLQLLGNQFGFDRGGFRVYVLCPARRSDILLGKNLAFAAPAAALVIPMVALVQLFTPMRWDHLLALVPQTASIYLLFCLVGNTLSIFAPLPMAAGTMQPKNPKLVPVLCHLLAAMVLPALAAAVTVPYLVERALALTVEDWAAWLPIHLGLSLCLLAAVVLIFRFTVGLQGRWMQTREQQILEVVTSKGD